MKPIGPVKEPETKLAALRAALVEGEHSGSSKNFDFKRFLDEKKKEGR